MKHDLRWSMIAFACVLALTLLLVTQGAALVECFPLVRVGPDAWRAVPRLTVVVPARLPNEDDVLADTLAHLLEMAASAAVVIEVMCNGPGDVPADVVWLADRCPSLHVRHQGPGGTKADNVMAGVSNCSTEVVALLDADVRPEPGALELGAARIGAGAAIVQGECLPDASAPGLLARVVRGEYLVKHRISYRWRARFLGAAYFAGSNGYWSSHVLRSVPLERGWFTEDVEASLRAQMQGETVMYEPRSRCREQPPPNLPALLRQRRRWAAGWRQVALDRRYLLAAFASSRRERCFWLLHLAGRRLLAPIALVLLVGLAPVNGLALRSLGLFAAASALVGAVQAVRVRRLLDPGDQRTDLVAYAAARPLIELMTLGLALVALFRLPGTWVVTPRYERADSARQPARS